jgi:hypothetical protein
MLEISIDSLSYCFKNNKSETTIPINSPSLMPFFKQKYEDFVGKKAFHKDAKINENEKVIEKKSVE